MTHHRILFAICLIGLFTGVAFAQTPFITTTALPNGIVGQQYPPQILTAVGGAPPYRWSVSSGSFPAGLTLSQDGVISGYPTSAGDFFFVITVQDGAANTGLRSMEISISPQLGITTTSPLPIGVAGTFYSYQIQAGGPALINWSIISGNPPPGLTLSASGLLVGTPNAPGTYQFTVQAANFSPTQTALRTFAITINPALTISTATVLPIAILGSSYAVSLQASGGIAPYTWTNLGGILPAGMTLSSDGTLKGIPTGLGIFALILQVADSFTPPGQVTRTFAFAVTKPLVITTTSLPHGIQNADYKQQLQLDGGTSPYTWLVTSGTLPAGLSLTTDGVPQGKPAFAGSQNITVMVTDGLGMTASNSFNLVIDPPFSALTLTSFPALLTPASNVALQLSLSQPYPSPLTGQLSLSFTSSAEVPSDDPMTQFSSGSRTVKFTIPANSTTAVFPSQLLLLTGTVTGTVRLRADIQDGPSGLAVATMDILALPPQITNVEAFRTTGGLDVLLTGYSPARRVTSVDFNFDVKTGSKTQRVTLTKNVDSMFGAWFQSPVSIPYGSAFSFSQSFTLQGTGSTIEAVTVTLKNVQGNTSSAAIRPQ